MPFILLYLGSISCLAQSWNINWKEDNFDNFKKNLDHEFSFTSKLKILKNINAVKSYWNSILHPDNQTMTYDFIFDDAIQDRVKKFEYYFKMGGCINFSKYENIFFHTLKEYYLHRNHPISQDNIKILKVILDFNDLFHLPWEKTINDSKVFFHQRRNWMEKYSTRLQLHFIDQEDWKSYRLITMSKIDFNISLFYHNNEFLPNIKKLMVLFEKDRTNYKYLKYFEWTLQNYGIVLLKNYNKKPIEFHDFLIKLSHENHSFIEHDMTLWKDLNGLNHLLHTAKYKNMDIFQWLISKLDYRSLAHVLHLRQLKFIPHYEDNINIFHLIAYASDDKNIGKNLSSKERDYAMYRFTRRLLWHDYFPLLDRIQSVFTKESKTNKTPIELIDENTNHKTYNTFKYFECLYSSWLCFHKK